MARTAESRINPLAIWKSQLDDRGEQIAGVLPAHIPLDRFKRVAFTAAMQNPDLLLKCDRTSLFNAVMKAATDGLMPDSREGAIVEFKGKAQWMPMIAGLRKKVRQSGEISTWSAEVVYENDHFDYQLGDEPYIIHKPVLQNRGEVIAAYSIATLKSGEKSREVMTIEEIEKVREVSRMWHKGPWSDWFEEMAKKTVARRHSKILPMNTDLDDVLRRDDAVFGVPESGEDGEPPKAAVKVLRGLKGKLAVLAGAAPAAAPKAAERAPEGQREPIAEARPASRAERREEEEREVRDEVPVDDEDQVSIDDDGVIDEVEGELQREQVDPLATAYDRGVKARRSGVKRSAIPGEFRREDRAAEATAWIDGWTAEHKHSDAKS
jgi:recombination protein RecT